MISRRSLSLVFVLMTSATAVFAQSIDPGAPTPIHNANLLGKIAARDLGDSRLTDHYYMFKGTPGDLLITVQSRNLNGDLDVFTAVTLRPLLKLSLYAENTKPVTKAIYLRKPEDLILRIEARSPNDDEGTYQLFFGGSFEAIAGGPDVVAPDETPTTAANSTTTGGRKTKRVTSVGARIDEPEPAVPEVAAAPTPEPTPEARPVESPTPEKIKPVETAKSSSPRSSRNRQPAGRRTTTPKPSTPKETPPAPTVETKTEETTEVAKKEEPAAEVPASEPKPKATNRSTTKRSTSARTTTPKPPPEPEAEVGPRLIIETNDGTLINRSMSGVRRVTVEAGLVVVTGKDGKIDRIPLVNVVKMTIAP